MERKMYGLRCIGSPYWAGVDVTSNDGAEFCGSTSHTLTTTTDLNERWLVKEAWHAEWVRNNSTPWYNAGYDTPDHGYGWFKPHEWEVVEVKIVETITPVLITLPEPRTIFEATTEDKRAVEMFLSNGAKPDFGRVRDYYNEIKY